MGNVHHLVWDLAPLAVLIFVIYAYKTFTYVAQQHADYWAQRRGPYLPSIDLLYNSYMLLGFLLRRDYKALGDSALDKLADNARLLLILTLFICVVGAVTH